MRIITASYKIDHFDPEEDIRRIATAASLSYMIPVPETHKERCKYVKRIISRGHTSILEHSSMSVLFTINRGISHELVRHRHTAYTQESTRYCKYSADKFGNQLTFINNYKIVENADAYAKWLESAERTEQSYFDLLNTDGVSVEDARGVLSNDVKTSLYVTTNFREWLDIFRLRCDSYAHYQMYEVMRPLYKEVNKQLPEVFGDLAF